MTPARRTPRLYSIVLACAAVVGAAFTAGSLAAPGVQPSSVEVTLNAGESAAVTKAVEAPPQSPAALDVYFLADTTGSMTPALTDVKAGASAIVAAIEAARPGTAFGAGDYKDFAFDSYALQNCVGVMADGGTAAQACIDDWFAFGGDDGPEGQFYALHRIATGEAGVGYRPASTKVIAWFGDAPAHDPVCQAISGDSHGAITEASVTEDLVEAGIEVVAVSTTTGFPAGLDDDPTVDGGGYLADCGFEGGTPGQATRIAAATGGAALIGVPPDEVASTILGLITTLELTVTPSVTCSDPGIAVTFDPSSRTVTPGEYTAFTESIAVAPGTPGGTYTCTAKFLIDGADAGPAFTQAVTVTVPTGTVPSDRVLLFIDEDSIDAGSQPNRFAARAVNDDIAKVGLRTPLPAFDGANIGALYTLHTGDVGDEAWFAPASDDPRWTAAGNTKADARNLVGQPRNPYPHGVGPGLGTRDARGDRESRLDKVRDVVPLRATGLAGLVGKSVCAIVWDGEIGLNYDPINASLKGANLGTVAFTVLSSTPRTNGSSGALPAARIEVDDAGEACEEELTTYAAPKPRSSSEPFDTGR